MTNCQELLFFGALMSFYIQSVKFDTQKLFGFATNLLYSIGITVSQFRNLDLCSEAVNIFGQIFAYIGLIMMLGLFFSSMSTMKAIFPMPKFRGGEVYIGLLFTNLLIRTIIYVCIKTSNPDVKAAEAQPYHVIVNTVTILILGIIHSRDIKSEFIAVQVSHF